MRSERTVKQLKFNGKGLFLKAFLCLSAGNLLIYALMHISFNIATDIGVSPDFAFYFEQVRVYITDAWELVFPVAAASLMLSELWYNGAKKAFLGGLIMSLSRLFYSIFYYYLFFIGLGFDTSESIPYALLASVGAVLLCFLAVAVITGVGYIFLRRSKDKAAPLSANTAVLVAMSAVQFIIFLALEVVDTVEFFAEYGLDYHLGEIMLMVFNYVYILVMASVAFFLTRAILEGVEKRRLS